MEDLKEIKINKKGLTQMEADMLLVFVTFFWGVSYLLMNHSLTELDPFTLNMYRFIIASLVAFLIRPKNVINNINKTTIIEGLKIGVLLFLTYACTTFGIRLTSVSNTGFLCASTVVFTPIFSMIFFKKKPKLKVLIAVLFSFLGMALLTIGNDFSMTEKTFLGDFLCIMCGFFYAFDLLVTESAVNKEKVDAYTLGTMQLLTVGILNLIFGLIFEDISLPTSLSVYGSTLFLALFATGFSFIIQPIAQKYTTASRVGIIFTLEPVFNAIAAYFILKEVLSIRGYIGSIIMIISIFVMEIDFSSLRKGKNGEI